MKKMLLLMLLPLVWLYIGCGASGGGNNLILLGDAVPAMKLFEGNEQYDAVTGKVTYEETGMPSYDEIFRQIALLNASIKQYKYLMDRLSKDESGEFKEKLIVGVGVEFYKNALMSLTNMNKSAPGLQKQIAALNPQKDFTGLNAVKAPSVVTAISESVKNLEEAVNEIPKLMESFSKLSGS
jgi:hypothetical protein